MGSMPFRFYWATLYKMTVWVSNINVLYGYRIFYILPLWRLMLVSPLSVFFFFFWGGGGGECQIKRNVEREKIDINHFVDLNGHNPPPPPPRLGTTRLLGGRGQVRGDITSAIGFDKQRSHLKKNCLCSWKMNESPVPSVICYWQNF